MYVEVKTALSGGVEWARSNDSVIRIAVAAVLVYRIRLIDITIHEQVTMLWVIAGGNHFRVHNGIVHLYHSRGASQVPYV